MRNWGYVVNMNFVESITKKYQEYDMEVSKLDAAYFFFGHNIARKLGPRW